MKPFASLAWLIIFATISLMTMESTFGAKPPQDPPPPPVTLPTYTFQSLGTLGGLTSTAEGINEAGDVVGNAQRADNSHWPYVYTVDHPVIPDGMVDLQLYIASVIPDTNWVLRSARDINNARQIIGVGKYSEMSAAYRLTLPVAGQVLPVIENLGIAGIPAAINNDGDVAGHFVAEDGRFHAFLWMPELGAIDLGVFSYGGNISDTFVTSINDRDSAGNVQLVGYARRNFEAPSFLRGWRFDTASGWMQNLAELSGSDGTCSAFNLNNLGEITGYHKSYTDSTHWHAFVYSKSNLWQDIGSLGGAESLAYGINDFGDVVGTADTANGKRNEHQAFVKTSEAGMFKLEPRIVDLPADMTLKIRPWRINLFGQIIGPSSIPAGFDANVAYLITPRP